MVLEAKNAGKQIRGGGVRHSWADIYADEGNYFFSFYPLNVSIGKSHDIRHLATLAKDSGKENDQGSLYSIISRGLVTAVVPADKLPNIPAENQGKTLVRIGASVSSEQLRRWCIANKLIYPADVIMVEVSFIGAISACCHGSGMKTKTLADNIYEIEFVNCNGVVQKINEADNPTLIKAAAGHMGLMGLTAFVTIPCPQKGSPNQ